MRKSIGFFLGAYEDWGGASRALLNFVRRVDRKRFRPLVILTQEGTLGERLAAEGVESAVWGVHDRGANLLRYGREVLAARAFLRRNRVDLVHMNYGAVGWKPAEVLAARLAGVPIVSHFHLVMKEVSPYLRYSAAVVAVSRYVAEHSETFSIPTHVVHNIADLGRFGSGRDIRTELGAGAGEVVVTFLGQLLRSKGVELFVEMARRIEQPGVRFVIAGELRSRKGAYTRQEFEALIARDPRIVWLGYRSDPENLYASSDLVVMPSQWEEPCAMVLFESAAAGKPVVASATGGTPEIIRHGETGFLFERDDLDALVAHVRALVADPALRRRIGERARAVVEQDFVRAPVAALEGVYDGLLGARAPAGAAR